MSDDILQPPQISRPEISSLENAINSDGSRAFEINDIIVVESYVKNIWFDTRHYRVVSINDDSGEVQLYDVSYRQSAYTNYKTAPAKYGDVLKLACDKKFRRR